MRAAGGAWGSGAPICLDGLANGEGDLCLRIWGDEAERRRWVRGRKQAQNQDELRQNSACEPTCRKRLPRRAKTVPTGGMGDGSVVKRTGLLFRGPRFNSQHVQLCNSRVSEAPFWPSRIPTRHACTWGTMYMKQNTHTH